MKEKNTIKITDKNIKIIFNRSNNLQYLKLKIKKKTSNLPFENVQLEAIKSKACEKMILMTLNILRVNISQKS